MGRTFVRQVTQIRNSDTYDDTVAAGSTMESAPTDVEEDLNNIRSQLKRAIYDDGAGNWYDDIPTVNSKKRAISDLNTDLDDIEEKRLLFRAVLMTDVTVPASQNYVVLSQASSETPTVAAAVNAGTAEGAVVAELAGDVGSHALTEVTGPSDISPKNLVLIRDATTGDPVTSSSREVYGLLQTENGVVDSDAFNDTDHQVQISFVRIDATGDDLEAVPFADIENAVINYAYIRRVAFDNIPETAFLTGTFLDQVPTATSVTLDNAIDNQSGAATQTDRDIEWRITDTFHFKFQTSDGGVDLFSVYAEAAGDEIEMNVDDLDINNVNAVNIAEGLLVDTGGTEIDIGDSVAGEIGAAGLGLNATTGDLRLEAAAEYNLIDGNKGGSTYAGQLKLSETSTEWSDYETAFGEVSLMNAITQAYNSTARARTVAVVTEALIAADTNVTGAGGTPNIDAQLGDYSGVSFVNDVNIYLNGVLLRNGVDASANHDVYPGTTPANGDLLFEFAVKLDDTITMEIFGG